TYLAERGEPRSPADLKQHECLRIRLPNGAIYPWHFERAGEVLRLDVEGQFTVDEPSVAKAIVQANVALGLFMEQDVQAEIDAGNLQRVLEDWTPPRDELCLYYPNRRNPSAALKAFTDLARENLQRRRHPA
ncbi:LysR substrate-binding domain-containing protein, partial [Escherichia coli]